MLYPYINTYNIKKLNYNQFIFFQFQKKKSFSYFVPLKLLTAFRLAFFINFNVYLKKISIICVFRILKIIKNHHHFSLLLPATQSSDASYDFHIFYHGTTFSISFFSSLSYLCNSLYSFLPSLLILVTHIFFSTFPATFQLLTIFFPPSSPYT